MRTVHRLRIGVSLTILSGLFLASGVVGAVAFWPTIDLLGRVLTVLMCLGFAAAVVISLSIVVDQQIRDVPWIRLGVLAVVMLAGCGLALLREEVGF